jgi:hypothetical protein
MEPEKQMQYWKGTNLDRTSKDQTKPAEVGLGPSFLGH